MSKDLPVVTIVGRRNVGKSTLFNALIKEKRAIVDAMPGLTRDILSYTVKHNDIYFTLSDTPGLDLPENEELSQPIIDNAMEYLNRSSVILFLMEDPSPNSFDIDLMQVIRKTSLPTIIAVNKMDSGPNLEHMVNFYEMGVNDIIPISALRRHNIPLLLDSLVSSLPSKKTGLQEPDIRISIVGRPNSGKSTLINSFAGFNRSMVSDVAGTTRDPVDEDFNFDGKRIRIIDTAGMRKKSKMAESIEYYSFTRTIDAVNKSDVVIHLIDAEIGLSDTDKKISDEILKAGIPVIMAINKWDAIEKDTKTFEEFKDKLIFKFYRAQDFPVMSISAKDKVRINKLLIKALHLKEITSRRVGTPLLNKIIAELQKKSRIPQMGNLRIYYATQLHSTTPKIKFFVNNPDHFRKDTVRYFQKALQKELDMEGVPIEIIIEGKKAKEVENIKKKASNKNLNKNKDKSKDRNKNRKR
jgi:GTP-binding protein